MREVARRLAQLFLPKNESSLVQSRSKEIVRNVSANSPLQPGEKDERKAKKRMTYRMKSSGNANSQNAEETNEETLEKKRRTFKWIVSESFYEKHRMVSELCISHSLL